MKPSPLKAALALAVLFEVVLLAFYISQNRQSLQLLPGTEPDYQLYCWNTPVGETGRKQIHLFADLKDAYPSLTNEIDSLMDASDFTPSQRQHLCALVQQEQAAKALEERS